MKANMSLDTEFLSLNVSDRKISSATTQTVDSKVLLLKLQHEDPQFMCVCIVGLFQTVLSLHL